jgi:LPPG:FO 2-phospho-L-lactate transferase
MTMSAGDPLRDREAGRPVLVLSGGIGGAKLALGLDRVLGPGAMVIAANTGDDFEHLGLSISPDIDTLVYTLAGLSNPDTGWGRRDETWTFMTALSALGGETWFRLGDGDLAMHVERTRRLAAGETLSQITDDVRARLGIGARIVPMSNDRVRTRIRTDQGWLDFQDYFVRLRAEPPVRELAFDGAPAARPHPDIVAALDDPGLRAVVICPSNPLISVDPILAVPGIRERLKSGAAPVVAVSPIIGGRAVKGPTAKMMDDLGLAATATGVAEHYNGLIDAYVVDAADDGIVVPGVTVAATSTLMHTLHDRVSLARKVLAVADDLRIGAGALQRAAR